MEHTLGHSVPGGDGGGEARREVSVEELRRVKNSIIGNPLAKAKVARDVEFVRR